MNHYYIHLETTISFDGLQYFALGFYIAFHWVVFNDIWKWKHKSLVDKPIRGAEEEDKWQHPVCESSQQGKWDLHLQKHSR